MSLDKSERLQQFYVPTDGLAISFENSSKFRDRYRVFAKTLNHPYSLSRKQLHWTQEQSDAAEEAAAAENAKKQEKELRGGTGSSTGPLIPSPDQESKEALSTQE